MKAYYARPISVDNSPQAVRDKELIIALGYEPYPLNEDKKEALKSYKMIGMDAFRPYVEKCGLLIFRAFSDGSIGAGVAQEIEWAVELGIPIVEFPRQMKRRALSVEETREMLSELGQR